MKVHSDEAWGIASQYSYTLASDTRTLAAQIDDLVEAKVNAAIKDFADMIVDIQTKPKTS